jgi:hypothetical protein
MKEFEKIGGLFLILFVILIPIINAVQVVEVPQQQQPEKTGFWSSIKSVLKSKWFWGGILIFILIVIFLVIVFFVVKFLIKYLKSRADIFFKLKTERIKLAKIQRRYPSKAWWRITRNVPIRLVKKDSEGKLYISKPFAYHRGDYVTHEGNVCISLNLDGYNRFIFFPITDLLIIPNKIEREILQKDEKGRLKKITVSDIPKAEKIIQFNENEILIYAESVNRIGLFLIPVLKSKDGKIIDLSLPVFQSLKEVVIEDYLYEMTDEFSKVAKKSIDLNPHIRSEIKLKDANTSVEVPSTQR